MLVTLFGRRWLVLAPFSLYLTSAITAQATLWWISSLNQISIQATFFVAVGSWVQYLRTRRLGWLLGSALAVAGGLLFFQKALLVFPVLIFVALVYFASGPPWRRLVELVRSYWPAAVAMGAVGGGYALYSLSEVPQPFTDANEFSAAELAWNMLATFVTGALGGPWRWEWHQGGAWADTPTWLEVTAVAVAAAVVTWSILARRRAFWGWVLVLGYLAMQVVLIATSRAPVFGADIGLAYRLQTDVVCALVLGIGLAFAPLPGSRQSSEVRATLPGPAALSRLVTRGIPPSLVVGAVVLVGISGAVCWAGYARSWHDHNVSEHYLRTLDRDLQRIGAIDLADRAAPDAVLPGAFFAPDNNRVSGLIELLHRPADYPRATADLAVVSGNGSVHRALVEPSATARPGPHPNCGWLGLPPQMEIPLTTTTLDLDWWVRIGYLSTRDDVVEVQMGDDRITTRVNEGLGNLYLRTSGVFDSVVISGLSPDTRLCVDAVEVGTLTEGPDL
jgi:hypothetical protein